MELVRRWYKRVVAMVAGILGICFTTLVLWLAARGRPLDPRSSLFIWGCVLVLAAIVAPFVLLWEQYRQFAIGMRVKIVDCELTLHSLRFLVTITNHISAAALDGPVHVEARFADGTRQSLQGGWDPRGGNEYTKMPIPHGSRISHGINVLLAAGDFRGDDDWRNARYWIFGSDVFGRPLQNDPASDPLAFRRVTV